MKLSVKIRKEFAAKARAPSFVLDVRADFVSGVNVLFGPSGSGKSTLLDCIAGVQTPDEGRIRLDDAVLFDTHQKISVPARERRIAYVFQSLALFPHLSVEENVAYGLMATPAPERREKIAAILRALRIEALRGRKPRELSGGEQQRVALARSLVTEPRVLLLDEPLTGLDAGLRRKILEDLRVWNAANDIPILYVTHNRDEVDAIGKRAVTIAAGHIQDSGDARMVLDAPGSVALAEAIGFENLLPAVVREPKPQDGVTRVSLSPSNRELEIPFTAAAPGSSVQIAIRAGDILLATEPPQSISARNIFEGTILSMEQRGTICVVQVDAGVTFAVHVTPGAVRSLQLAPGQRVWLILKTHSCRIVV